MDFYLIYFRFTWEVCQGGTQSLPSALSPRGADQDWRCTGCPATWLPAGGAGVASCCLAASPRSTAFRKFQLDGNDPLMKTFLQPSIARRGLKEKLFNDHRHSFPPRFLSLLSSFSRSLPRPPSFTSSSSSSASLFFFFFLLFSLLLNKPYETITWILCYHEGVGIVLNNRHRPC